MNLCKILHKSNLGGLLGLPVNWPQVAGTSGEFTGSQLRKNFCEFAWERSLCELRHHGDEVKLWPVGHDLNLGALLGLPVNCKEVPRGGCTTVAGERPVIIFSWRS